MLFYHKLEVIFLYLLKQILANIFRQTIIVYVGTILIILDLLAQYI